MQTIEIIRRVRSAGEGTARARRRRNYSDHHKHGRCASLSRTHCPSRACRLGDRHVPAGTSCQGDGTAATRAVSVSASASASVAREWGLGYCHDRAGLRDCRTGGRLLYGCRGGGDRDRDVSCGDCARACGDVGDADSGADAVGCYVADAVGDVRGDDGRDAVDRRWHVGDCGGGDGVGGGGHVGDADCGRDAVRGHVGDSVGDVSRYGGADTIDGRWHQVSGGGRYSLR